MSLGYLLILPLAGKVFNCDMLNGHPSLTHLDRFNILSRANSFLSSHNLHTIDKVIRGASPNTDILSSFFDVAPITILHLDRLYFYTIYSDGPFSLIDFLLENSVPIDWIQSKLTPTADQIETHFKKLISDQQCDMIQLEFLQHWMKRQSNCKPIDSDLLALRTLETLILLAIINFQKVPESHEAAAFQILEDKLMDWAEAAGLIRSLTDNQLALITDTSMDIDFNPNSESSTLFALKPNEFDIYLLEKLKAKGFRKLKEIVEIVTERCGIPVDSESEELPVAFRGNQKAPEPAKHWRRVKPETIPVKHVASSKVSRPSSLSVTELKSTRFLSSTSSNSSRQVDLTLKQPSTTAFESNSFERNRRRYSENSAPQILQQTTPTKSKKSFNLIPTSNTSLADSFVILETPPRALSKKPLENDLTGSVRRLFSSQPMMEE